MRNLFSLSAILALGVATHTQAHPHLFVGVDVAVIYDGDTATAVRLTWRYDDFFSLMLTSDLGVDLDGDLILDPDETRQLTEAIINWPDDFNGDLEVRQGGEIISLDPKAEHMATYVDGLIVETHVRPISGVVAPANELKLRIFDPFYYVAYQLNGPVAVEGRDNCTTGVIPPDLNAAHSLVDELLYGRPASDVGADESFPEVGAEFAETIVVSCAG